MALLEISFIYQMFCFHSCVLQEDFFAMKLRKSSLTNHQFFGNVLFSDEAGARGSGHSLWVMRLPGFRGIPAEGF